MCLLVIWVFGNEGEPRNHKGGTGDDRRSFDVVVVTSPTDKTLDVLYAASSTTPLCGTLTTRKSFLFKYQTGEYGRKEGIEEV